MEIERELLEGMDTEWEKTKKQYVITWKLGLGMESCFWKIRKSPQKKSIFNLYACAAEIALKNSA